ncbi:chemotaxis protein CheR [Geomonas sp.]|uniref:chemotaxis protein CheR n=1 Tax=Geomonas sp. TaxID=2651584 RepID=UPI002B48300A|nr:chemotaxis protein CheR [Geomonas sp.]HJV33437.1 chemotaxis protein CheR [Geomonas sp.]
MSLPASYLPTLDKEEIERRLDLLLVPGALDHPALLTRIERLADSFQSYAGNYPLPLWAPGLAITNEMRGWSEALFPVAEAAAVFAQLLRKGCRFAPLLAGSYLHTSPSWPDLLQKLGTQVEKCDPAPLLRELAADPRRRKGFLFALLLPRHFGGGFDRYPVQSRWLESWLAQHRSRLAGTIRALDSACGSGEGTYGLAELAKRVGFAAEGSHLHGSTIEEIELFAGTHAFFPHDQEREREYRARVAPLLSSGSIPIRFYLEEVCREAPAEEPYDVILCNGLLGGPLLHEADELSRAVRSLASRLAPGGVLLAADRFHAGWRRRIPAAALRDLLRQHGLTPLQLPEGIGGQKPS